MATVTKRPQTRLDLISIWQYIADDNQEKADQFLDKLEIKFKLLSQNPLLGRTRKELMNNLRSFPYKRYVIFYTVVDDGVEIVRVLHSAMDVETIFSEE